MQSLPTIRPTRLAAIVLGVGLLLLPASSARAQDLCGDWSGHWEDCKSGHCGPLKATFCKCDDCHYRVTFTGRFFKIFPFRYTVVLSVVGKQGDKVILAGESNLGPLFGTFTYHAEATASDFIATYSSCRYEGKFILARCGCH